MIPAWRPMPATEHLSQERGVATRNRYRAEMAIRWRCVDAREFDRAMGNLPVDWHDWMNCPAHTHGDWRCECDQRIGWRWRPIGHRGYNRIQLESDTGDNYMRRGEPLPKRELLAPVWTSPVRVTPEYLASQYSAPIDNYHIPTKIEPDEPVQAHFKGPVNTLHRSRHIRVGGIRFWSNGKTRSLVRKPHGTRNWGGNPSRVRLSVGSSRVRRQVQSVRG